MCTNGMFIVPRKTPGVEIMPEPRNHNHVIYHDVRVPLDHLLGPEDGAKVLAQRRLGGGRIHHAMRTIAQCKLAFDMMCERALSRESHGKIIADHQMVQEKIADSYASIRMLRLFVLETAWKIDNTSTQETRTDIAAVKYTMAKVLREVSFNALHILGSLGTTNLTPLQAMYAGAPTMGIADGVDEVHKATVARNVLKQYRPHEGYWPTEYYPAKRAKAREKFEPLFQEKPEFRELADQYAKYMASGASPTRWFLVDPPSHSGNSRMADVRDEGLAGRRGRGRARRFRRADPARARRRHDGALRARARRDVDRDSAPHGRGDLVRRRRSRHDVEAGDAPRRRSRPDPGNVPYDPCGHRVPVPLRRGRTASGRRDHDAAVAG